MPLLLNLTVSRLASPSTYLVDDHDEAYDLWREAGVQNQILLHFDAHIDFEWIAEKDPLKVLAQKSLPQALEEFKHSHGWSFANPVNNFMHLGNYLYRALQEGMIKSWYWIVPDSIWENPRSRKQIWRDLLDYYEYRTGPMDFPQKEKNGFRSSFLNVPFLVTSLRHLPEISEPALVNIDVDYLTTSFSEQILSPALLRRQVPWIWPEELFAQIERRNIQSQMTTLSNSVQGGFTPIQFKFFGSALQRIFSEHLLDSEYESLKEAFLLRAAGHSKRAFSKLEEGSFQGIYEATRNFLKAQILYEQGQTLEAKRAFENAVEADPEFFSSYNSNARYYENLAQWKNADEEHQMIRDLCPDQIEARIGEADSVLRLGKQAEAIAAFKRILNDSPTNAGAAFRLANLYANQKAWPEAETFYQLALRLNPQDLLVRIALGHTLLQLKRYADAKTCLREALGLGAHFPQAYYLLSQVYFHLGFFQKSAGFFFEMLQLRFKIWKLRLRNFL